MFNNFMYRNQAATCKKIAEKIGGYLRLAFGKSKGTGIGFEARGYTDRGKFEIQVKYLKTEGVYKLFYKTGHRTAVAKSLEDKQIILNEFYEECLLEKGFEQNVASYSFESQNEEDIFNKVKQVHESIKDSKWFGVDDSSALDPGQSQGSRGGAGFEGTRYANYGERDFMAAMVALQGSGQGVIPGCGSNFVFEHTFNSEKRADALELDEEGNVITVVECMDGIRKGKSLDHDHLMRALCVYPRQPEIKDTIRKIVIIAGGYTEDQLYLFANYSIEVVALVTTVVNGEVVLVPATNLENGNG